MNKTEYNEGYKDALEFMKRNLVVCCQCVHMEKRTMYCEINRRMTDEDGFCNYGERKEAE